MRCALALAGCDQKAFLPEGSEAPTRPSFSEGWVSSGGELLRDARNPWWVKNTSQVKYCIAIDERSVSVDESYVEKIFKDVLENWHRDFRRLVDSVRKYGGLPEYDAGGVGQQTFVKVGCEKNPDLRIVLGYEALDFNERKFIADPARIAAYAVRTHYDPVELRGKGFIFLGSESGPYRFQQRAYRKPWATPFNLGGALYHEMGHVFGIGHLEMERIHYMREGAIEALFEGENRDDKYIADFTAATFLSGLSLNWGHMVGFVGRRYERDSNFAKFFMINIPNDSAYNLHAWKMGDQEEPFYKKIGLFDPNWEVEGKSFTLDIATIDDIKMRLRKSPVISIYLTPEQKIFTGLDYSKTGFVRKSIGHYLDAVGSGTAHCGKDQKTKKPVLIEMDGTFEVRLFGEVDGEIRELLPRKKETPEKDEE